MDSVTHFLAKNHRESAFQTAFNTHALYLKYAPQRKQSGPIILILLPESLHQDILFLNLPLKKCSNLTFH